MLINDIMNYAYGDEGEEKELLTVEVIYITDTEVLCKPIHRSPTSQNKDVFWISPLELQNLTGET
jgi:hypothetical protein